MANFQEIRIATRSSRLALCQAELVKTALQQRFPALKVTLVPLLTTGDKMLDHPLATAGGKGLFIKELEHALLEQRADIAVHSLKDMPANCATGLMLAAFLEREDPRDAFLSTRHTLLSQLPPGARVGTASLRRKSMVHAQRSDLQVSVLRGNVETRLSRLAASEYDAIILAAAGLHRLGLQTHIRYYFPPEESLPAIGQGIIAIECRQPDKQLRKLLSHLDHYPTRQCALAERALNQALGGNCHAPIAGYATMQGKTLQLRGRVFAQNNRHILEAQCSSNDAAAEKIGETVARQLLQQGAAEILQSYLS